MFTFDVYICLLLITFIYFWIDLFVFYYICSLFNAFVFFFIFAHSSSHSFTFDHIYLLPITFKWSFYILSFQNKTSKGIFTRNLSINQFHSSECFFIIAGDVKPSDISSSNEDIITALEALSTSKNRKSPRPTSVPFNKSFLSDTTAKVGTQHRRERRQERGKWERLKITLYYSYHLCLNYPKWAKLVTILNRISNSIFWESRIDKVILKKVAWENKQSGQNWPLKYQNYKN